MAANGGSLPSFLAPYPPPVVSHVTPTSGDAQGQGDASANESIGLQLTTPSSLDLFASPAPSQAGLGLYPLMSQLQGQVHALQGQVHALRAQEGVLRAEMDRIAAERDYLDSATCQLEAEKDILASELTHAREGMAQYTTLLRAGQELEEYTRHMDRKMEAMAARISQLLKEKEDWAASQAHLAILARVSLVERCAAERWGGAQPTTATATTATDATEEEEHTGPIVHAAKKARRAQPQEEQEEGEEAARAPYSNDVSVDLSTTGFLTAQVAKLKQAVADLQLKLTISASALRRMREESVSRATAAASLHAKVVRNLQARHEGEIAQREGQIAALKALVAEAPKGSAGSEGKQGGVMDQEEQEEEKAPQA